jgi:hypothetical protein
LRGFESELGLINAACAVLAVIQAQKRKRTLKNIHPTV